MLEFLDGRAAVLMTLPELASAVTRDTKALDHRRALSRLVLGALASHAGVRAPERAEPRRELWDTFNVVVGHLAQAITGGGGELRYHGDSDWPGLAIATAVIRRHNAAPWRMSSADYLAGLGEHTDHVVLGPGAQPAHWDPELSRTMADAGAAVYEEAVAELLVADLT